MTTTRMTGQEPFHRGGAPLDVGVLDFWQWADSELLSNALRGRLAEYLVALDLGVADGMRTEWDPYDLRTLGGITVEVKSGAYLQAWYQPRPSKISFKIARTLAWDPTTGKYDTESRRQAQVYVFAVLGGPEQTDVDPLDLSQWRFHVLGTETLDNRLGGQKTLALGSLLRLEPEVVEFGGIRGAVERAVEV